MKKHEVFTDLIIAILGYGSIILFVVIWILRHLTEKT